MLAGLRDAAHKMWRALAPGLQFSKQCVEASVANVGPGVPHAVLRIEQSRVKRGHR